MKKKFVAILMIFAFVALLAFTAPVAYASELEPTTEPETTLTTEITTTEGITSEAIVDNQIDFGVDGDTIYITIGDTTYELTKAQALELVSSTLSTYVGPWLEEMGVPVAWIGGILGGLALLAVCALFYVGKKLSNNAEAKKALAAANKYLADNNIDVKAQLEVANKQIGALKAGENKSAVYSSFMLQMLALTMTQSKNAVVATAGIAFTQKINEALANDGVVDDAERAAAINAAKAAIEEAAEETALSDAEKEALALLEQIKM